MTGWEAERERLRKALEDIQRETMRCRGDQAYRDAVKFALKTSTAALSEPKEQTTADRWIEWKGGECPVPVNTAGTVKLRDGTVYERKDITDFNWGRADWCLKPHREIVAYRLSVQP